jgi:alcohol dehydrogenase (cytochrome c)/quinohemoprotein ethanol dehydrogenase
LVNRLSRFDGSLSKAAITAIRTYVILRANEDKALDYSRKIARRQRRSTGGHMI